MRISLKLDLPRGAGEMSGNASIHSLGKCRYHAVVSVTKHQLQKPVRTEVTQEFTGRSLLFSYLQTRAAPASSIRREKARVEGGIE